MSASATPVDGFKFLPPKLSAWIKTFIPEEYSGDIPFQPLQKPLNGARVALVTSAGISVKPDPPFDMEREKKDPTQGDPSSRMIPITVAVNNFEVSIFGNQALHQRFDRSDAIHPRVPLTKPGSGWPRQLVAWVAKQQEGHHKNLFY